MDNPKKHLDALSDIKNLMERSSKFISFSGLSAISAGIIAITGAVFTSLHFNISFFDVKSSQNLKGTQADPETLTFLIITAVIVFLLSMAAAILISSKKARDSNLIFWDNMAKRVFLNLFIFLFTGGIFCALLIYHQIYFLIVPAMLIFYGLALINVSKFTMNEIAQLGIFEIILGIAASFVITYPLLIWVSGFGILHLIYGTYIYLKYERKKN
ncbi:MAG: hypothetical protein ABIY50_08600 [Ignavibacteria bacterium]